MSSECELANSVERALNEYFKDLDGQPPHAVYDMVLGCIEKPMLQHVMKRAAGNQSKAAEILGVNRNTLRKKLQQHKLD